MLIGYERRFDMPYNKLAELPQNVKNVLPKHGQEIYQAAFNNACKTYQDKKKRQTDESLETIAHKVAWAAVEEKYHKDQKSGKWHKK